MKRASAGKPQSSLRAGVPRAPAQERQEAQSKEEKVTIVPKVLNELQHSKKTGPKTVRTSTERRARIDVKKSKSTQGARGLGLKAKPFIPAAFSGPPFPPSSATAGVSGSEFHEATNPKGIPVDARLKLKVPRAWELLQTQKTKTHAQQNKFGPGPSPNVARRRRRSSLLDPTAAAFAKSRPSRRSVSESIRDTARDLRLQREARERQRVSILFLTCNSKASDLCLIHRTDLFAPWMAFSRWSTGKGRRGGSRG